MPSPPAFSTGLARERQFVEYMETRRIEPQSPSSPQLTLRYSQLPPAMVGDRGGGGDLHLDDLLRPLLAQLGDEASGLAAVLATLARRRAAALAADAGQSIDDGDHHEVDGLDGWEEILRDEEDARTPGALRVALRRAEREGDALRRELRRLRDAVGAPHPPAEPRPSLAAPRGSVAPRSATAEEERVGGEVERLHALVSELRQLELEFEVRSRRVAELQMQHSNDDGDGSDGDGDGESDGDGDGPLARLERRAEAAELRLAASEARCAEQRGEIDELRRQLARALVLDDPSPALAVDDGGAAGWEAEDERVRREADEVLRG